MMSQEPDVTKWKIDLDAAHVTEKQSRVIDDLLHRLDTSTPQVEDIWLLMDDVWDELGGNNLNPDPEMLVQFYSHPVWLLNSLFIEQDSLSMRQREAIRTWIASRAGEIKRVVDFGGGLGTLGILIGGIRDHVQVEIYEPFSSRFAEDRIEGLGNVRFITKPDGPYDCLLAIDVLEHVTEPLQLLNEMIENVRSGGYMIIANNFSPVIKCHLPRTFHLRFTFRLFARLMGLHRLEPCYGSHATIYKKTGDRVSWSLIHAAEWTSKLFYYPLHVPYLFYRLLRTVQDQ